MKEKVFISKSNPSSGYCHCGSPFSEYLLGYKGWHCVCSNYHGHNGTCRNHNLLNMTKVETQMSNPLPSTEEDINSGALMEIQDQEKGSLASDIPSNSGQAECSPPVRKKYAHRKGHGDTTKVTKSYTQYYYDILGTDAADGLIRDAHNTMKCKNCWEIIGELLDINGNKYGWMHHPFGESYTFCKCGPGGEKLKKGTEAEPK